MKDESQIQTSENLKYTTACIGFSYSSAVGTWGIAGRRIISGLLQHPVNILSNARIKTIPVQGVLVPEGNKKEITYSGFWFVLSLNLWNCVMRISTTCLNIKIENHGTSSDRDIMKISQPLSTGVGLNNMTIWTICWREN